MELETERGTHTDRSRQSPTSDPSDGRSKGARGRGCLKDRKISEPERTVLQQNGARIENTAGEAAKGGRSLDEAIPVGFGFTPRPLVAAHVV